MRRITVGPALLRWVGLSLPLLLLTLAPPRVRAQEIGELLSPGKLSRAHATLEGVANCQKCHEPGRKVTAERCLACHKPVAERIAAHQGVHRDVKGDCVSCHVEHAGLAAEIRSLDRASFDHKAETGFALDGLHTPLACESCHKTRSFLGVNPACATCHKDVHQGLLGPDCARCHPTSVAFAEARRIFDHSRTSYPLTGAHRTVSCEKCHKTPDYRVARFGQCDDCHRDPHEKPLGVCSSCHTTESWHGQKIEHAKTGFPLLGKHATIACAACHVQPAIKVKLKFGRCADCHRDPHGGVFKEDCASCHKETGFAPAPFDHFKRTGYALDGEHAKASCASCHKGAAPVPGVVLAKRVVDFRGARKECVACHKDVHAGELGEKCESCHTAVSFKVPSFKHPRFPEFFTASHADVPCEKCHAAPAPDALVKTRLFKNTSVVCSTCHKDVHLGQLGDKCETCHTVKGFAVATYRHRNRDLKGFFAGGHATAACQSCHKSSSGVFPAGRGTAVLYQGIPTDCASCHQDVHHGTLGTRCASCHLPTGWKDPSRAFHKASFPLEGKHLDVACASCHIKGVMKGTPRTCFDCHWIRHRDDRYQTRLGSQCEDCHRPTAWNQVNWDHFARTGFALNGAHLGLACESCHKDQIFLALATDCITCHRDAFLSAKQPNHVAAGFPTDCTACHGAGDTSWTQGRFDHTIFPLVGLHAVQPCAACHKGGVFKGTPRDCFGCHKPQFDQTKNPPHAAAGFPTSCDTCHRATDVSWNQGRFDHKTFPLVGVHATQPCAACHPGGVFAGAPRDCYGCHRPQYDQTKNPPHAASGFPTTCDTCHKATDPSWNLGVFNHAMFFPLVGVHATVPCTACHINGVYKGTPRDCYGCHKKDYDGTNNPQHAAWFYPTTCDSCHHATDANWTQFFSHPYFNMNHGGAGGICTTCHPIAGNPAVCSCKICHPNRNTCP